MIAAQYHSREKRSFGKLTQEDKRAADSFFRCHKKVEQVMACSHIRGS